MGFCEDIRYTLLDQGRGGVERLLAGGLRLEGTGVPHLQENAPPSGPYRRPMPRVLGWSQGGGRFLMGEVPL